ncbi:MAG: SHOCT domain-containing protein [Sulfuricella sp.]
MNVEGRKDGSIYTTAIQAARRWHGIVEVLMKRADSEEKSLQNSERQIQPALSNASVADEIKKLADLRDSGVLSADEFQQQKTRLLGSGA